MGVVIVNLLTEEVGRGGWRVGEWSRHVSCSFRAALLALVPERRECCKAGPHPPALWHPGLEASSLGDWVLAMEAAVLRQQSQGQRLRVRAAQAQWRLLSGW